MERRNFLKLTGTFTGGLLVLPEFLTASMQQNIITNTDENILVFIQLNGGNDGLNTIIPYQDPLYYEARQTIGIPKSQIINSINSMGFHPALKDLAKISQDGNLSIIQNVGYPNPNRSHFRSQEIWQTASDVNQYLDYGWLGRFMDIQCKDQSLPALNIDSIDNLALKSTNIESITIKDVKKLHQISENESTFALSKNPQLDFVRRIANASTEGMVAIEKALKNAKSPQNSYANNELSNNLKWISQLIKGKLNSKIYYTSLGGFDTHNNQLSVQNKQLTILNDAIFSMYQDLKTENLLRNVTIVVFSEFGRRVHQNGTGTDHGTAGPMLIIGGNNKGKLIGQNPDLTNLDNGDLKYKIDFRAVYKTLLENKFGFDAKQIGIQQEKMGGLF